MTNVIIKTIYVLTYSTSRMNHLARILHMHLFDNGILISIIQININILLTGLTRLL